MKPDGMSWRKYIRLGVGRRLSMLGERLGWHWLTYNPIHFLHFHEHALENAPGTIRAMRSLFPDARRWLDVGAGSGAFTAEATRQGAVTVALEHSRAGRRLSRQQDVDIRRFDLSCDPPAMVERGFDLAYCFEVAEHLPPDMGDALVAFLAQAAPIVVFTAAHPGQGGTGHINEQPKAYWIERFHRFGMTHDSARSATLAQAMVQHGVPGNYLIDNAMVFERAGDKSHQDKTATVVITTRNRKDELRSAIRSALDQDAKPEILVIDDGSSDGTGDMVRSEFPAVRLHRCEQSRGLIARRNLGATLARGRVILSIDDDATFSSPHVVSQTLALFDDPRIGAVAIPFINIKQDDVIRQRAPDAHLPSDQRAPRLCERFIGTAHALRRDVFLRIGGYRAELVHQGEEGDLCLRMLAAGCVVRMGIGDPIHHHESPRRDLTRMTYYGRRNDVLFAFDNVPLPAMLAHLVATTIRGAWFGLRTDWPLVTLRGIVRGYAMGVARLCRREPVPRAVYRLSRRIKANPGITLDSIRNELPICLRIDE